MKQYVPPEMEIIKFENGDVITTSSSTQTPILWDEDYNPDQ